eukprot:759683-Hanusia_phi.AAC.3
MAHKWGGRLLTSLSWSVRVVCDGVTRVQVHVLPRVDDHAAGKFLDVDAIDGYQHVSLAHLLLRQLYRVRVALTCESAAAELPGRTLVIL